MIIHAIDIYNKILDLGNRIDVLKELNRALSNVSEDEKGIKFKKETVDGIIKEYEEDLNELKIYFSDLSVLPPIKLQEILRTKSKEVYSDKNFFEKQGDFNGL
jgi:hypothetical protein